jgi:hypothetical protein
MIDDPNLELTFPNRAEPLARKLSSSQWLDFTTMASNLSELIAHLIVLSLNLTAN